jgi:hypothetical protein
MTPKRAKPSRVRGKCPYEQSVESQESQQTWRSRLYPILLESVVVATLGGVCGVVIPLLPQRLIEKNALTIFLAVLCFLPAIGLLLWAYEKSVLQRFGKTSILWLLAGILPAGALIAGVVLITLLGTGTPPGHVAWLSLSGSNVVALKATPYGSNGPAPSFLNSPKDANTALEFSLDRNGVPLLAAEPSNSSSESLVEVPFEVGMMLEIQRNESIGLEKTQSLHLKIRVAKDEEGDPLPQFGIGIKDATHHEAKYLLPAPATAQAMQGVQTLEWAVPLSALSGWVSLKTVRMLVLFARDLAPGQHVEVRLESLSIGQ